MPLPEGFDSIMASNASTPWPSATPQTSLFRNYSRLSSSSFMGLIRPTPVLPPEVRLLPTTLPYSHVGNFLLQCHVYSLKEDESPVGPFNCSLFNACPTLEKKPIIEAKAVREQQEGVFRTVKTNEFVGYEPCKRYRWVRQKEESFSYKLHNGRDIMCNFVLSTQKYPTGMDPENVEGTGPVTLKEELETGWSYRVRTQMNFSLGPSKHPETRSIVVGVPAKEINAPGRVNSGEPAWKDICSALKQHCLEKERIAQLAVPQQPPSNGSKGAPGGGPFSRDSHRSPPQDRPPVVHQQPPRNVQNGAPRGGTSIEGNRRPPQQSRPPQKSSPAQYLSQPSVLQQAPGNVSNGAPGGGGFIQNAHRPPNQYQPLQNMPQPQQLPSYVSNGAPGGGGFIQDSHRPPHQYQQLQNMTQPQQSLSFVPNGAHGIGTLPHLTYGQPQKYPPPQVMPQAAFPPPQFYNAQNGPPHNGAFQYSQLPQPFGPVNPPVNPPQFRGFHEQRAILLAEYPQPFRQQPFHPEQLYNMAYGSNFPQPDYYWQL